MLDLWQQHHRLMVHNYNLSFLVQMEISGVLQTCLFCIKSQEASVTRYHMCVWKVGRAGVKSVLLLNCSEVGVLIANPLLRQMNNTGTSNTAAKFIAPWKSPCMHKNTHELSWLHITTRKMHTGIGWSLVLHSIRLLPQVQIWTLQIGNGGCWRNLITQSTPQLYAMYYSI